VTRRIRRLAGARATGGDAGGGVTRQRNLLGDTAEMPDIKQVEHTAKPRAVAGRSARANLVDEKPVEMRYLFV
jgi:hypothetical protein